MEQNKVPCVIEKMKEVPLFRTVNGVVKYLKEKDPDCDITAYMLREAIKSGDLKSKQISNKYILDVDDVINFFKSKNKTNPDYDECDSNDRKMGEFW